MKQLQKPIEVFVIGPYLIYAGTKKSDVPIYFKIGLAVAGTYIIARALSQ